MVSLIFFYAYNYLSTDEPLCLAYPSLFSYRNWLLDYSKNAKSKKPSVEKPNVETAMKGQNQ